MSKSKPASPNTPQTQLSDPPPSPPRQPELEDCCRSGCTPCVFDLYEAAMERYQRKLEAWQARQSSKRS